MKRNLKFLEETANQLRQDVIEMLVEAGTGHQAGALEWRIFSPLFIFIF